MAEDSQIETHGTAWLPLSVTMIDNDEEDDGHDDTLI